MARVPVFAFVGISIGTAVIQPAVIPTTSTCLPGPVITIIKFCVQPVSGIRGWTRCRLCIPFTIPVDLDISGRQEYSSSVKPWKLRKLANTSFSEIFASSGRSRYFLQEMIPKNVRNIPADKIILIEAFMLKCLLIIN
jgi:hypothetical protein